MNDHDVVEILLVEDNPQDAELTIRALKKHNLANRLFHVEDGAEALDFLFARGKYEGRRDRDLTKSCSFGSKAPQGQWIGSLAQYEKRSTSADHPGCDGDLLR